MVAARAGVWWGWKESVGWGREVVEIGGRVGRVVVESGVGWGGVMMERRAEGWGPDGGKGQGGVRVG